MDTDGIRIAASSAAAGGGVAALTSGVHPDTILGIALGAVLVYVLRRAEYWLSPKNRRATLRKEG